MSLEFLTYAIWIDSNIDSIGNKQYYKEFLSINNLEIECFKTVEDALSFIFSIHFEDTIIILNSKLYNDFIGKFKEKINIIYIIPKIIIFTSSKEKFLDYNKNYKFIDSFYKLGGIATNFDEIKDFILNPKPKIEKKEENQYVFEYFHSKEKLEHSLVYQNFLNKLNIISNDDISKFTEYIYNKYSSNRSIKNLFKPIQSIPNIPIELLSKFYARIYTVESDFIKI